MSKASNSFRTQTVNKNRIKQLVQGKNVLFVATTYLDYLRIQQELSLIEESADSVKIIVGKSKYYIFRLVLVYWKLLLTSSRPFDVVFCGFSPQLILPFWHWKFKKKTIVIDFFISLYDTLVFDRKKFSEESLVAKLLLKLDKYSLSKADWIISDTFEHAKYFVDGLNADESKLMVLYLQADKKYYYPRTIQKTDELKDKFVVFYFATVLPLQGVDIVVEAISHIKFKDIHFIFVGPISYQIKELLLKQQNLSYHSWLSQEELADLIAQSDLCLAGHFNNQIEKAKRTIPGKAYIFEAMSKAMVLGDNKANRERFPMHYNKVKFVKMGSVTALTESIKLAYQLNHYE